MKSIYLKVLLFVLIIIAVPVFANAEELYDGSPTDETSGTQENSQQEGSDSEESVDSEGSSTDSVKSDEPEQSKGKNQAKESDSDVVDENDESDTSIEKDTTTYEDNSPENTTNEQSEESTPESQNEQAGTDTSGEEKLQKDEEQQEEHKENQEDEEEQGSSISTFSNQSTESFTYKYDDRDDEIVGIKQMLNTIGFDGISETNYFGNWTETRVEQFQNNYNLTVSGEVDQETFDKLEEVYHSLIKPGDHNPQLIDVKEKLNSMGFNNILVTDYYGNWTETRVKQFQDFASLDVTGLIDQETLTALDNLAENGYSKSDSVWTIANMKEKLNATGFDNILVTNNYGNWTETRVHQFQENYNLNPTGNANKETLDKLNEVYNSPFQQDNRHNQTIELKEMLNTIGYGYITVTDLYGSFTEIQVKSFQNDYGLKNNGIADELTRQKVKELYDTTLQLGDNDDKLIDVKEKLNSLGFNNISVTDYFGGWTETRVKQFQDYAGLNQTGILNPKTINALDRLANNGYSTGDRLWTISNMKEKLNAVGFDRISVTNYYGNWTETRVSQFQDYYGLTVTGNANKATLDKLNEVYNSPYQEGKRHSETIQLKERLNSIGFGYITVTELFGDFTKNQVEAFQGYYGLKVNGIADGVTREKINRVYNHPLQNGKRSDQLIGFKEKLNAIGYGYITVTNYFGNFSKQKVEEFQSDYGLRVNEIIDQPTQNKINQIYNNSFKKGDRHSDIIDLKESLNALGYGTITVTTYYGNFTEKKVEDFQRDNNLKVTGVATPKTVQAIEDQLVNLFIDPGHGGHDPGGTGHGLEEKDLVLDISLKIANYLTSNYYGIKVDLSRVTDEFIELEKRSEIANEIGSDFFLSVHTNAWLGKGRGFESYIHDNDYSSEDIKRQNDIHDYLMSKFDSSIVDRGKKDANFNVLRNSDMPSLLIEYLFIDNKNESDLLRQASYRSKLAQWTGEALAQSFNLLKR